jgi:hypothetical protein
MPDLDLILEGTPSRWYMDLDAPGRKLTLGMSDTEVEDHVFYVRKPGASYPKGRVRFGFLVRGSERAENPFVPCFHSSGIATATHFSKRADP